MSMAVVVMLSLSKQPASAATATTVHIVNFAFSPATVTVAPGTVVTFVNDDSEPHTVTALLRRAQQDKGFDSGGLDTGDRWTHAFTKPGRYTYFCALHHMMHGVVIVKGVHA